MADATSSARSERMVNTESPYGNALMLVGLLEESSRATDVDCWLVTAALDALREDRRRMDSEDAMAQSEALLEAIYERLSNARRQLCMEGHAQALLDALKPREANNV